MPSVIIVSVWQSLGFYLVIFFAALQSVPTELYEAAELDGANAWSRFLHVTVPTIRPVILIVIVLNTINGIKVFDQIWVMTAGGPELRKRDARHLPLRHRLRGDGRLQFQARLCDGDRHRHPAAQHRGFGDPNSSWAAPGPRLPD